MPFRTVGVLLALCWLGASLLVAAEVDPVPTVSGKALFSDTFEVGDALARMVDLPAQQVLAKPLRSVDGSQLFILEQTGVLHQIAIPAGTETMVLDLHAPVERFAQAKDGLLVSLPESKQLLLIDSKSFKIVRHIPLPTCAGLAASMGSSLIYVANRSDLTVINATTGQIVQQLSARALQQTYATKIKKHPEAAALDEFANPVLTPDGRYLICRANDCMHRLRCDGTNLIYEEVGARISQYGNWFEISEDGAYVALSACGDGKGVIDHPIDAESHSYVYKLANLLRPVSLIASGEYPYALAFDKKAGRIYTMNREQQFMVYTAQGIKEKDYRFTKEGQTKYIMTFPAGYQALVGTEAGIFWIDLPGPGGLAVRPTKKSTGWLQPLVPVTAKPATALPATLAHDDTGAAYVEMTSTGQSLALGDDVIGIAAAPSGEALYVIHRNDSIVGVVDPATWKTVAEIVVPQSPVSVWCDGALIAVACPESKVVALIDPLKREVVRSVGCPTQPTWQPQQICGRAPDGGIVTRWQAGSGEQDTPRLVHIGLNGTVQIIGEASLDGTRLQGGTWLPDGRIFFGQTVWGGMLVQPNTKVPPLELRNDLFPDDRGFQEMCGPAFITQDNAALVLPRRCHYLPSGDFYFSTFLLAPRLDRVLLQIPGAALCEIPDRRLLITLDREVRPAPPGASEKRVLAKVRYIARASGKVLRVVHLEPEASVVTADNIQLSRYRWTYVENATKGAVYIPGHELLVVPEKIDATSLVFTVFQCGPPAGVTEPEADVLVPLGNDPPAAGKPGTALKYIPNAIAAGGKGTSYRIKRPLPGMSIDAVTGTWSWTPSAEQAGTWQVTILATVDGKEVQVVSWALAIR